MFMDSKEDSGIGMIPRLSLPIQRVCLPCMVCSDITSDRLSDWWITFTVSK